MGKRNKRGNFRPVTLLLAQPRSSSQAPVSQPSRDTFTVNIHHLTVITTIFCLITGRGALVNLNSSLGTLLGARCCH